MVRKASGANIESEADNKELNSKHSNEELEILANKFINERNKARVRNQRYVKKMKRDGFHRISSLWLKMGTRDLKSFAQWLKNQDPADLIWLKEQNLQDIRNDITSRSAE